MVKPLSLDDLDPRQIRLKAANWIGRVSAINPSEPVGIYLLIGMPSSSAPSDVKTAAEDGVSILHEQLETRRLANIVPESEADTLANRVAIDIKAHEATE